jgi:cyclopropane fatty-acyl-phospholipid synthase-like methyltransferase
MAAPTEKTKKEVEGYYDSFKEHQAKLGINVRHRTIFKNLLQLGLQKDSKVLEIGCGIGTVSHLILSHISAGKFVGADISPESIAYAKKFNASFGNASFVVNDMQHFESPEKFDFVVLPDVLEHIPVEQHNNLFRVLASVTSSDAKVLINIPEPGCLDWIRATQPEKLQIIDQSLNLAELFNNANAHGFKVNSVTPYCLQYTDPDYISITLKKKIGQANYTRKSKYELLKQNMLSKI